MGFFKEFKEFAMRGNVVDMAVGVVIGTSFGKIVSSLVSDVIMPCVGKITGNMDFSALSIKLSTNLDDQKLSAAEAKARGIAQLSYGVFFNTLIDFIIVALAIFVVIRLLNRFRKAAPPPPPAGPTREEILLTEIRDSIRAARR